MTYYNQIIEGTENNAIAELKSIKVSIALLQKKARMHRKIVSQLSKGTDDQDSEIAYYAIRTQDNLLEIINCIIIIASASYNHLANHHKPLNQMQLTELKTINENLSSLLMGISQTVKPIDKVTLFDIEKLKNNIEHVIEISSKNEVKRIREELTGNRSSILFMSTLQETRNIVYFTTQVLKSLNK